MNLRMWRVVFVLSLALLCGACATANLNLGTAVPTPPPQRVDLQIDMAPGINVPPDVMDSFRTMITKALAKRDIVQAGSDTEFSLDGIITLYKPGNRALRYFIGFGVGKGKMDSSWTLKDYTGAVIAEAGIDGSISMGVGGGTFDEVLVKAAKRVAEFVAGPKE